MDQPSSQTHGQATDPLEHTEQWNNLINNNGEFDPLTPSLATSVGLDASIGWTSTDNNNNNNSMWTTANAYHVNTDTTLASSSSHDNSSINEWFASPQTPILLSSNDLSSIDALLSNDSLSLPASLIDETLLPQLTSTSTSTAVVGGYGALTSLPSSAPSLPSIDYQHTTPYYSSTPTTPQLAHSYSSSYQQYDNGIMMPTTAAVVAATLPVVIATAITIPSSTPSPNISGSNNNATSIDEELPRRKGGSCEICYRHKVKCDGQR
jgi:hypothetical protein